MSTNAKAALYKPALQVPIVADKLTSRTPRHARVWAASRATHSTSGCRKALLQLTMPGMRSVAGHIYCCGAQRSQLANSLQHGLQRLVCTKTWRSQRTAAVRCRNLRQPVLREGLVRHRNAASPSVLGTGRYKPLYKVSSGCRTHTAQNTDGMRGVSGKEHEPGFAITALACRLALSKWLSNQQTLADRGLHLWERWVIQTTWCTAWQIHPTSSCD